MLFTGAQIQAILNTHNQWRSNTAGGNVRGYQGVYLPQAVRMAKMQWNSQLAQHAELNTKQCAMKHDKCRSTNQFHYAGQNLYLVSSTGTLNVTSTVVNAVHGWASESNYTRVSDITTFTTLTGGDGKAIGHFTVLAHELSTHVGCGLSLYTTTDGWNAALFACNYAYTNMLGRRIYLAGPTASQCTSGRDGIYSNLCTINENINPNRENIYSDTFEAEPFEEIIEIL